MKRTIILSILLCSLANAANEIRAFIPGATITFAVVREIDGDVFYPATNVFEVWGTGARTAIDYGIAMVSKSGGMWVGVMDTDISAGYYYLITHQQAGVNPVDTDPAVWHEYGYWSGTVWQPYTLKTIEDLIVDANDNIESYVADVPTTEEIRIEMDANSTDFNTIIVDVAGLDGAAMRGTNNANTVVPDAAGTAAALHVTTNALITGLNDITVDEILAGVVEGSYTVVQILRGLASVNMGLVTGGNTTNIVFRDLGDTKNRVDTTVNSVGNRTAITLDLD